MPSILKGRLFLCELGLVIYEMPGYQMRDPVVDDFCVLLFLGRGPNLELYGTVARFVSRVVRLR